jgi:hypothetical protein
VWGKTKQDKFDNGQTRVQTVGTEVNPLTQSAN